MTPCLKINIEKSQDEEQCTQYYILFNQKRSSHTEETVVVGRGLAVVESRWSSSERRFRRDGLLKMLLIFSAVSCSACMFVCVRVMDPLEMGLETVVSSPVCDRNRTWVLWRSRQTVILPSETSLQCLEFLLRLSSL